MSNPTAGPRTTRSLSCFAVNDLIEQLKRGGARGFSCPRGGVFAQRHEHLLQFCSVLQSKKLACLVVLELHLADRIPFFL